jgi:ATP-binding protein involved in chromosome partitioning
MKRSVTHIPHRSISIRSIPHVRKVVLVAAGKGGVGKSTTSVNLALSLSQLTRRVGVLDADIHGPSIPTLLNMHARPHLSSNNRILPLENYGVKCISIGNIVKESSAVAWRGAMVKKALDQLLFQVDWGTSEEPLDVLVVDMPPGTGDVHLSICQQIGVDGVVLVSTLQHVALIDVERAASLYRTMSIPVLGMVVNMSTFACPTCNTTTPIFGTTTRDEVEERCHTKVIGNVPLVPSIVVDSDQGIPAILTNPTLKSTFHQIAQLVYDAVNK